MASSPSAPESTHRLLIVEVRGRHYGLDADRVQEIVPVATTARLAGAPPWVLGLMNLRGTLVPAMDLGVRIDPEAGVSGTDRTAVILRDGARFLAMVVDEVHEVQQATASEIEAAPPHDAAAAPLITGMGHFGGQIVLLIDVSELLRQVLA